MISILGFVAIGRLHGSKVSPELVSRTTVLEEEIRKTARTWHESGKAQTLRMQYLETHSGVSSLLTFG